MYIETEMGKRITAKFHTRGVLPLPRPSGAQWPGDSVGDQGMTMYGAEGNSTCTTPLRGTSIIDRGLQLWQKTTRPKPLPRGSQAVTSHTAVSKAKQKKTDNFFFSLYTFPAPFQCFLPPGSPPSLCFLTHCHVPK